MTKPLRINDQDQLEELMATSWQKSEIHLQLQSLFK